MSIGTGIGLFVVGAILAFAIHNAVVSLQLIGYILMVAGVVVFILGLVFTLRKRQSITTVTSGVDSDGRAVNQRRTATTPDDI